MRRKSSGSDKGAVAVEFVLVLPLLLILLLLMVDLGRLMFVQISLNAGSKEAVRALALGKMASETDAAFITRVTDLGKSSATGASKMAALGSTTSPTWVCGTATFTSTETITSANCTTPTRCLTAGTSISVTMAAWYKWLTPLGLPFTPIGLKDHNISSKAVSLCLSV